MMPDANTLVLGGIVQPRPGNAGCPDATVELLRGGTVVDRRSVSCEQRGKFKGIYVIGTMTPMGPMTPSIARGFPSPSWFRFQILGMASQFAWWGAEEFGQVNGVRFTVPVPGRANLLGSIVTAVGAAGGGTMALDGVTYW
jgi:hypothetical protein